MQPFTGEIRMFGGNFAPRDWTLCQGQLLAIQGNEALFSLLQTAFGGDGIRSFGLPDLRGRIPVHQGSAPGLTPRERGGQFGVEAVTLGVAEMPTHNHPMQASTAAATTADPVANALATPASGVDMYTVPQSGDPFDTLADSAVANAGRGGAHDNLMPFLCIQFIIALQGIYPQQP